MFAAIIFDDKMREKKNWFGNSLLKKKKLRFQLSLFFISSNRHWFVLLLKTPLKKNCSFLFYESNGEFCEQKKRKWTCWKKEPTKNSKRKLRALSRECNGASSARSAAHSLICITIRSLLRWQVTTGIKRESYSHHFVEDELPSVTTSCRQSN